MNLEADVAEPALLSLDLQLLKYHQAVVCLRYVHGSRLEELVGELGGHGGCHGGRRVGDSQLPFFAATQLFHSDCCQLLQAATAPILLPRRGGRPLSIETLNEGE